MPELPQAIRDRTPPPHSLRVGLRRAELPSRQEVAAFCGGEGASLESGDSWVRLTWGAARDTLLVLLAEDQGPESFGFDHALIVESSHSKTCFLAAYFIARRCGGVVQVRQRAELIPATAFAERYLEGEDLEERWGRVFPSP